MKLRPVKQWSIQNFTPISPTTKWILINLCRKRRSCFPLRKASILFTLVHSQIIEVIPDGSKIEAQTPDGTRVATPNSSTKDGLSSNAPRASLSTRASYAAALKAKPTDWHLEFSMDDHILPLDLTIYGAIHQHEMRNKTGAAPSSMIWQGVYTIKFQEG